MRDECRVSDAEDDVVRAESTVSHFVVIRLPDLSFQNRDGKTLAVRSALPMFASQGASVLVRIL